MKKDLTLIGVLVDRSGSMNSIRDDMESGLKAFLDSQKELEGMARVTLAQFDTEYELVWPIIDINKIAHYRLVPRGGTALLDAMGKFITDVGVGLNAQPERERPSKVVVITVTDGAENSSREWTQEGVRKLIEQQRDVYQWEFVFLGANMDAVTVAQDYGIPMASAMTYAASAGGVQHMSNSVSGYVSSLRSTGAAAFTDKDRDEATEN